MSDEGVQKFLPQVGTLKLSEAMRIGAKLRPQGKDVFFYAGATCALGAAAEARGWQAHAGENGKNRAMDFLRDFEDEFHPLFREIAKRNDSGESRESIADWLAAQGY